MRVLGVYVSEPSGATPGRKSMSWSTGDSSSGGYVKYDSLRSVRKRTKEMKSKKMKSKKMTSN